MKNQGQVYHFSHISPSQIPRWLTQVRSELSLAWTRIPSSATSLALKNLSVNDTEISDPTYHRARTILHGDSRNERIWPDSFVLADCLCWAATLHTVHTHPSHPARCGRHQRTGTCGLAHTAGFPSLAVMNWRPRIVEKLRLREWKSLKTLQCYALLLLPWRYKLSYGFIVKFW